MDGLSLPPTNRAQFEKLLKAILLNVDAALKSCSWGKFQIMGDNYDKKIFSNVKDFVKAMYQSEHEQLKSFKYFIRHKHGLLDAMKATEKDWAEIARLYNGEDYKKHKYDDHIYDNYHDFIVNSNKIPDLGITL